MPPMLRRRGQAARVGHGMAGFREGHPPDGHAVAVLDDDEAAGDAIAESSLGGARHRPARLSAAQDEDARAAGLEAEPGADEGPHVARGERGLPDRVRVRARAHAPNVRRRSPASRSTASVFGKQNRIVEHPLRIPKDLARPGWPEAALECISRQSTSTPNARATPESRRRGDTIFGHSLGLAFSHDAELGCKSHRATTGESEHHR